MYLPFGGKNKMIKKAKKNICIRKRGINVMKRSLNLNKLANKTINTISYEEALKDVIPMNWSKEVLNGTKKVIICGVNK